MGETPLGNLSRPIGFYEVLLRHPDYGERKARLRVTGEATARLNVDMRPARWTRRDAYGRWTRVWPMPRSLLAAPAAGLAQDVVARRTVALRPRRATRTCWHLLERASTRATDSPFAFDVMRYRALCWLALGQDREAERAIAALVDLDPFYAPDAREVSPRVAQVVRRGASARLPGVARTMLVEARRALRRQDGVEADRLLRLASQTPLRAGARHSGRTDRSCGWPPTRSPSWGGCKSKAHRWSHCARRPGHSSPKATQRPSRWPRRFPAWEPWSRSSRAREYDGAVRVWVDAAGKVTAAAIERATHPPYDRLVLETAREWRYRPARRGGVHVAAEPAASSTRCGRRFAGRSSEARRQGGRTGSRLQARRLGSPAPPTRRSASV